MKNKKHDNFVPFLYSSKPFLKLFFYMKLSLYIRTAPVPWYIFTLSPYPTNGEKFKLMHALNFLSVYTKILDLNLFHLAIQ